MPAWGLVKDSPLIYAAQKGARAAKKGFGGGASLSGRSPGVIYKITFKGLVLYKPILNFEVNDPRGMVGRHMAVIGEKIKVKAQAQVGVKTGRLRQSIHVEHLSISNKQYIKVGSKVSYALMHHEGTRPHVIAAHPPGMLKFRGRSGAMVFKTAVMHPGTKPNRYLSSQLRKVIR